MKSLNQTVKVQILKSKNGSLRPVADQVVAEQPLEIAVRHGANGARRSFRLAVTMRTPGEDLLLALGFLFTENVIQSIDDVMGHRQISSDQLLIELEPEVFFNEAEMHRNIYTSSSCGVCGKASLERVQMTIPYLLKKSVPILTPHSVSGWSRSIREKQLLFEDTGGIHAAGLFAGEQLMYLQEDVGRHNAMDKLIGQALTKEQMPLHTRAVMVSGRASFELVQKALMAGIPILAAVGAPSSLAIELADQQNMTLIGFVKGDQFNIYCGEERVQNE